ncbi:hypothetical protein CPT03_18670 [Pedobacter ginsengisoli]|uniref:DUF2007 domain-containing protein n=1 Tax=Pedobacter ginsengisoli TaxID=363852 RepID=A0A2D1U9S5_9SPHI|nr:DUF2007 domain-containing protein [Pedobacter ginsengisoli]ATP58342.1 hypothetical protein CPT03_18670 [Pedobacter ginsengisoli]
MSSNWIKVYETEDQFQAEILKQGLMAIDIDAVVLNKQDSSYKTFGILSVLVHPDNLEKAKEYILENNI